MSSKAKNEITGKLSSRVMNMKFMKHAETVEQGKQEEDKVKKLIDSSEWKLKGSEKYIKSLYRKKPNVVSTLSFTNIKKVNSIVDSEDTDSDVGKTKEVNIGRKTFTKKADAPPDTTKEETENGLEPVAIRKIPDGKDLDALWQDHKRSNKRKKGDHNSRLEKKRSKQ